MTSAAEASGPGGPIEDDSHAPMDVLAMNAEAVVRAAIAWRLAKGPDPLMDRVEWELYNAAARYGNVYRGLRAQ